MLADYSLLLVGTILVNNIVLVQLLGLYPLLGGSNQLESAFALASVTTVVLTLTSMCNWIIYQWLLVSLGLEHLNIIAFIVVIVAVVQATEIMLRKNFPLLQKEGNEQQGLEEKKTLGALLPLIATNCAVLGVALLTINQKHNFIEATLYGVGTALGFSLVLILFTALRERLVVADVPAPFQGLAINLITAGLMALAFMGFAGLV